MRAIKGLPPDAKNAVININEQDGQKREILVDFRDKVKDALYAKMSSREKEYAFVYQKNQKKKRKRAGQ